MLKKISALELALIKVFIMLHLLIYSNGKIFRKIYDQTTNFLFTEFTTERATFCYCHYWYYL